MKNQQAKKVVKELREKADESKPIEGIAKHRLIDKIVQIQELREERNSIVENDYNRDRLMEINKQQNQLIKELKTHGVPHHPIMGSKNDYKSIETDSQVKA